MVFQKPHCKTFDGNTIMKATSPNLSNKEQTSNVSSCFSTELGWLHIFVLITQFLIAWLGTELN